MATLTITTTNAQDLRLIAAFGRLLGTTDAQGDPRNATGPEIKAAIVGYLRTVVLTFEQQRALELATLDPFDPT